MKHWLGALTLLLCLPGFGAAQTSAYPSRQITLVITSVPGGVTDVTGRALAQELSKAWGQPVVVENKGGAAHIVGAETVAKAAPDGYTLMVGESGTFTVNPTLYPKDKLPFDTEKDFVPITNLYFLVEALFVNTSLGVNTIGELKSLVQSKPTAFNFGTLGPGSYPDLFLRWVNKEWDAGIVGIPYRGGGPIAQELVAGQLQIAKMGIGNFLGLLPTGKIKPLAVTSTKRSPLLPEVPTFAEAGIAYPGFGWWGLAAPKGTCDTHMHFYDRKYPAAPTAQITPPDASVDMYQAMAKRIYQHVWQQTASGMFIIGSAA